ncbi:actin cytoskeletal 2a [Anaeramoeba flamelloides]|uniref:Actin cytoskeletal 2a n=1 Tax=Anaeramoeba flamelloides TaxID=1746091 RepID=A0AAV7ZJ25_9EUKA|nr:actin cytoskeletal 2a [Anaeramoeba flamelloides]
MLETFNVQSFSLAPAEIFSLYSYGLKTGIVIDLGYECTQIACINEGIYLDEYCQMIELGGNHLSSYLMKPIAERGYSFTTTAGRELLRDMKEQLCSVAADFVNEYYSCLDKNYKLPDGQLITLGNERFRCTEVLFQPNLLQSEKLSGVHQLVFDLIEKCDDLDLRRNLYSNIILYGGASMFKTEDYKTKLETWIRN